jgi:hypothetical protein
MPRKIVGGKRRTDAEPAPVQQGWNTDKIAGQDPAFQYQFMREDEVRDRQRRTQVLNRHTGKHEYTSGWTVCKEGEVELLGSRPDTAAPVDTTLSLGGHVLMKIPRRDHELLLHQKDAVPDAIEARIMRGGQSGSFDGVASQVDAPFAPHPALMGQQGAEDYSTKEAKLIQKLGSNL